MAAQPSGDKAVEGVKAETRKRPSFGVAGASSSATNFAPPACILKKEESVRRVVKRFASDTVEPGDDDGSGRSRAVEAELFTKREMARPSQGSEAAPSAAGGEPGSPGPPVRQRPLQGASPSGRGVEAREAAPLGSPTPTKPRLFEGSPAGKFEVRNAGSPAPSKRAPLQGSPDVPTPQRKRDDSEGHVRKSISFRRSSKRPRLTMQRNTVPVTCALCCEDDIPPEGAATLECMHGWYCSACLLRYLDARLESGAVDVPCPQCGVEVAEHILRRLLPAEAVERLLARSLERAVSAVADLRACPTPNCPMRVALEEGGNSRLKCPMCQKTSCLRCGAQPFHRGLTCERYAERRRARSSKKPDNGEEGLRRWMEETGSKQCPTCKMAVTKENLAKQGTQRAECHKMLCRNCDTKFCFKCLAVLTDSYTCGCTRDEHGFVDPRTGQRMEHLRPQAKRKR